MSAFTDDLKLQFSPSEKNCHEVLRELLWLLYPSDETKNDDIDDAIFDIKSDENAAMIMDGLKTRGVIPWHGR